MTDTRVEYTTQGSVLKLLSDLDSHELGRGVQRASASNVNMNSVLPRKAIHKGTWSRMLTIVDGDSRRGTTPPTDNEVKR